MSANGQAPHVKFHFIRLAEEEEKRHYDRPVPEREERPAGKDWVIEHTFKKLAAPRLQSEEFVKHHGFQFDLVTVPRSEAVSSMQERIYAYESQQDAVPHMFIVFTSHEAEAKPTLMRTATNPHGGTTRAAEERFKLSVFGMTFRHIHFAESTTDSDANSLFYWLLGRPSGAALCLHLPNKKWKNQKKKQFLKSIDRWIGQFIRALAKTYKDKSAIPMAHPTGGHMTTTTHGGDAGAEMGMPTGMDAAQHEEANRAAMYSGAGFKRRARRYAGSEDYSEDSDSYGYSSDDSEPSSGSRLAELHAENRRLRAEHKRLVGQVQRVADLLADALRIVDALNM